MGFTFSDHSVDVEIEGKTYTIELGDAEVIDQVEQWSNKLQGIDYTTLADNRVKLLTHDVRGYLVALLGQEQFDSVFEGRGFNFIDALELFAYLWSEVSKARIAESFQARLVKYMPEVDWDNVEE